MRVLLLWMVAAAALPAADLNPRLLEAGVGLFEDAVEQDRIKGAVLLVAHEGRIALHQAVGVADPKSGRRLELDALFRMASNTKAVVAAAILILADEGKLRVDDPVRQHLPAFDNYRSGRITIHHLLTHTGGFRIEPIFLKPLSPEPTLQKEVAKFGEIGALYDPGTTFSYNNPGYNTLGAIVEAVSERPLAEFLKERISEPLGMRDSSNHESTADHSRMSAVYRFQNGAWERGWAPGDDPDYPFVRASGGMISSAPDYVRFCWMLLGGGAWNGVRILSKESAAKAVKPHTRELYSDAEAAGQEGFYGYGWRVGRDGVFSHGGSDGTWAWADPNREIVGLVFTQSPGGGIARLREQFRKVVEAAVE